MDKLYGNICTTEGLVETLELVRENNRTDTKDFVSQ